MRPLRARVIMVGHDSLSLFRSRTVPVLFAMRRDPSKFLECDNGQRNFQDGISICQEAKWQASHDGRLLHGLPSSPCFGVLDMGHLESIRSASRHI